MPVQIYQLYSISPKNFFLEDWNHTGPLPLSFGIAEPSCYIFPWSAWAERNTKCKPLRTYLAWTFILILRHVLGHGYRCWSQGWCGSWGRDSCWSWGKDSCWNWGRDICWSRGRDICWNWGRDSYWSWGCWCCWSHLRCLCLCCFGINSNKFTSKLVGLGKFAWHQASRVDRGDSVVVFVEGALEWNHREAAVLIRMWVCCDRDWFTCHKVKAFLWWSSQARDCSRRQARYALRDDDEREKITRYVMMILMMIVMISSFRWVMKTIIIVSFVIIVFRKKSFDQ